MSPDGRRDSGRRHTEHRGGGSQRRGARGGPDGGVGGGSGGSGGSQRRGVRGGEERVVAGLHPVRELLRGGQPVTRILVSRTREPVAVLDEIETLAAERDVAIERHDPAALDARCDRAVHQGVIALAPPFVFRTLVDVLARAEEAGTAPLLVALDGVTDPHNLGSIARTAEAVGAHALLLPSRRAAGIGPVVEKSAAGALAHLPVVQVTNLVRSLQELHERGVWSLGLDADAEVTVRAHPLASEPCVLVVGAEGRGLARLTRERCDALVRLPMRGNVGSLNASVAAAVALYALAERRGWED